MEKFNQLIREVYNHKVFDFFVFITLSGIVIAQFLISPARAFYNIAMGIGIGLAFISFIIEFKTRKFDFKVLACFFVLWLMFFISMFLHQDFESTTVHDVNKKLQWFWLPFIFLFIKRIPLVYYYSIIGVYVTSILFIGLYNAIPFSLYVIRENQAIDFPRFQNERGNFLEIIHHNLAMQCYFGICMLFFLIRKFSGNLLLILLFAIVVLIFSYIIYITGARVGFLSIVLIAFIFLFTQVFLFNWRLVFILIFIATLFSGIFYYLYKNSEIIRYRVNHTIEEISFMYNEKLENWYPHGNFTVRILSNKYYIELFLNNKWIGVSGPSDSKYHEALHKHYTEKGYWSWVHKLYPANQWVRYLIQLGLPTTIVFFLALFLPVLFYLKKEFMLVLFFTLGLFIYSNTETPLDPTISFTIISTSYAFFLLIAEVFASKKAKKEL